MTGLTVFYSWQSDRPSRVCRNFIAIALEEAVARLKQRRGIEIVIDSDTQGEPGTPPVNETILRKIRDCDVFMADMSFVAATEGGKLVPNPNVMAEYGYALREKGTRRIVLAMNTAFGPSSQLPFDLHHLRHPASYDVPESLADGARRTARAAFSGALEIALETVADDIAATPAPAPVDLTPQLHRLAIDAQNARSANRAPVIVSNPSALINLVPAAALNAPTLDLTAVATHRHLLTPSVDLRSLEGQDHTQWWAHGPIRRIGQLPNAEAQWSSRLLRPGIVELVMKIGERIDDDREIVVEGLQLEASLVGPIDRGLQFLSALGLEGPTLIAISLYGLDDVHLFSGRGGGRFNQPSLAFDPVLIAQNELQSGASLKHAFDMLWLASGRSTGSPSYSGDGEWAGYAGGPQYAV